jgi:hypothetical protein
LTFDKIPENQLLILAKKDVTLALMVLSGLFHLYELVQACTSSKKVCVNLLMPLAVDPSTFAKHPQLEA